MAASENGIRIVVIGGSVRPGNYTNMALALAVDELRKDARLTVDVFDPAELTLPLPGAGAPGPDVQAMIDVVSKATGVILVTPEYHGSFSSVMKLIIDNLGFPSALAGKPIALLGVAAGVIGAIKALEHLRSVCSHVGAIVLPGPVSVAGVGRVFDEAGNCQDEKTEALIRGVATKLVDYIEGNICPRIALEELVRNKELS
jgi:FMN reductase